MDKSTKWKRDTDGQPYSEKAVAKLLLLGTSRAEISRRLDMPLGTVNYCCTRIYQKAGCKNLVEFILKNKESE